MTSRRAASTNSQVPRRKSGDLAVRQTKPRSFCRGASAFGLECFGATYENGHYGPRFQFLYIFDLFF
jgi:hypothetical protein